MTRILTLVLQFHMSCLVLCSTSTGALVGHHSVRNGGEMEEGLGASPFPAFSWDTVPVFWHAANQSGPLSDSALDFIARFPLATIEKFQAQQVSPKGTGAEAKIVAAAKQIKERNSTVKVLFYLNSIMDWDMYNLHDYCKQNSRNMWLYDDKGKPVMIRDQTTFNVTSSDVRQIWINTVLEANGSGYIDGVFVDRGQVPLGFPDLNNNSYAAWSEGHDLHMAEIQQQLGPNKIVLSNNRDYASDNARMFERFFVSDFDKNAPYADLLALMHEATYPHLAEAHGEPCMPAVFNASLTAFLIGAGEYAYYACTSGWDVNSGWMKWYDEYSKPLGAPESPAKTISSAQGFCKKTTAGSDYVVESRFWEEAKRAARALKHDRRLVSHWIDKYWEEHVEEAAPILGRRFSSGTCVTLDFSTQTPTPCIAWSDGTWTGTPVCAI